VEVKVARIRRPWLRGIVVAALVCVGGPGSAWAQALGPAAALQRISAQDITESLVSLSNFSASPGIEGSNLNVDLNDGQPNIRYSRFSIQIPISIETRLSWLNVYTDIGYGSLWMNDRFYAVNTQGEPLHIEPERQLDSGRIGLGVEFRPTPGWHITPYFAAVGTKMTSSTRLRAGNLSGGVLTPVEQTLLANWSTAAWSVGGVLDVKYLHWFGEEKNRLDLQARYAIAWTETFNESLSILRSSSWRNTLVFEGLWRSITNIKVFEKRLGWNVFVNTTSFPGQDRDDLGFNYYFGIGAGVDVYVPERLFGKIGRNFIGIRGSGIVGNDVRGWSVVVSLRS